MRQSFEKFCEETDLQGLSYINKSTSKVTKALWVICVLAFTAGLVGLVSYNFWLYSQRPKGINQKAAPVPLDPPLVEMIVKKTMELPAMQLCFRWSVNSDTEINRLNISHDLAMVLQWRIEATYLVDYYTRISAYAARNRSYADIETLLNRTKGEYDALMQREGYRSFEDLLWRLRPKPIPYHWGKFKNVHGEVSTMLFKSQLHPFIFSYYEIEMGFGTFICEIINEAHSAYAAEIPINYPGRAELHQKASSPMTRIFLSLSRLVAVKDEYSNVIARVRPSTNCFVSYSITTFEAINSEERPCIAKDDGCQTECQRAAIQRTFPGCDDCQSIFSHVKLGNWTNMPEQQRSNLTKLPLCDPWAFAACDFGNVKLHRGAFKACQAKCKPLCNQTKYNYRVQNDALEEDNPSGVSRVIIEPEKGPLKAMHIQQYEIMTIASILSDFGGYLGLFLGSSLLTMIHLCVFCLREAVHCSSKKLKRYSKPKGDRVVATPIIRPPNIGSCPQLLLPYQTPQLYVNQRAVARDRCALTGTQGEERRPPMPTILCLGDMNNGSALLDCEPGHPV